MEVDMPPFARLALPDAGFLKGLAEGDTVWTDALVEADVADDGDIAHEADVRRADRGLSLTGKATEVEVEAMEVQPLDALAKTLRLEGGQARVAKLLIDGPVAF